uniref:ubiquinol-cytochrome C chaperone family protein n=1 Tax=uncultured Parasphingorhabdus sp. TaxID=2709694 RepID=UPI0030DB1EE3
GGRVGAYREALENGADLQDALLRNIFRGERPDDGALSYVAERITAYHAALQGCKTDEIIAGHIPDSGAAL